MAAQPAGGEVKDPLTGATPYNITAPIIHDAPSRPIPPTSFKHIWYVTGPAGCGKTTAAATIAQTYGLPYLEGDAFHPQANITKMAAGHPLTDDDRWSWLALIRDAATKTLDSASGVIITCSALKKTYREVLRGAATAEHKVHFLYLALSPEELVRRVEARQGHYMKAEMVRSQLAALQEPDEAEQATDSVVLDAGRDFAAVRAEVLEAFETVVSKSG